MKTQAVILDAVGDTTHFRLGEIPLPEPKLKEVRVRIKAASFNPVDYKIRKGLYGGNPPMVLGADFSGIIDKVGEGVDHLKVGDEVYGMAFGQCSNGTYAQFLALPASFVAKKPKHLSFEQAACVPLVALTAYRAVVASGALSKNGSLFIAGAGGGVGSIGVQLARHLYGSSIYTIASSQESADWLAYHLHINLKQILIYQGLSHEQLIEKLMGLHGGRLFSSTLDFVGNEMKKLCVELTAHGGHLATITPEEPGFELPVWIRGQSLCFGRNLSLHFVFVGSEAFSGSNDTWEVYREHLERISELLESGAIQAPACQTVGKLSVATVQEAHRLLESEESKESSQCKSIKIIS